MSKFLRISVFTLLLTNWIIAGVDKDNSGCNFIVENNGFKIEKKIFFSRPDTLRVSDTTNNTSTHETPSSVKSRPDSLLSVESKGLTGFPIEGKIFNSPEILNSDYRFAGNLFSYMPFGLLKDLGQTGQPSELSLYGLGYNRISVLNNGISTNNRLQNSFDLYDVPDINIMSIEVIPLPRGFLYGSFINPVTVNIIADDKIADRAYSRVRYYQAPNSEGNINAAVKLRTSDRLGVNLGITNQSTDPRFENSDYSHWNGSASLIYLISDKLNVRASYDYMQNNIQLNGGVDKDAILATYPANETDAILFDNISAPVRFSDRYMKNTGHSLNVKMTGELISGSRSDISVYFQSGVQEFRQNEDGILSGLNSPAQIKNDNKYNTSGIQAAQDFQFDIADIYLSANYETSVYNSQLLFNETTKNSLSITGKAQFKLFDSSLRPSVYARLQKYDGESYAGAGGDIFIDLSDNFSFYAGASLFHNPRGIYEKAYYYNVSKPETPANRTFELSVGYKSSLLNASAGFIHHASDNTLMPVLIFNSAAYSDNVAFVSSKNISLNGLNLKLELRYWKFMAVTNSAYYSGKTSQTDYRMPEFTSQGGFYYIDTLFNNNLNLKTGINYKWHGSRPNTITDFQKSLSAANFIDLPPVSSVIAGPEFPLSDSQIAPSVQLDFFLAGKIQERATVYFVFENLLNNQYYIVSYYPMFERGVRLGVTWEFLD